MTDRLTTDDPDMQAMLGEKIEISHRVFLNFLALAYRSGREAEAAKHEAIPAEKKPCEAARGQPGER